MWMMYLYYLNLLQYRSCGRSCLREAESRQFERCVSLAHDSDTWRRYASTAQTPPLSFPRSLQLVKSSSTERIHSACCSSARQATVATLRMLTASPPDPVTVFWSRVIAIVRWVTCSSRLTPKDPPSRAPAAEDKRPERKRMKRSSLPLVEALVFWSAAR